MAAEYANETQAEVAKKVYPPERPRLVLNPARQGWLMMWDEVGLSLDCSEENDKRNSGFVIAPVGKRAQINAPKSSSRVTLITPLDGLGAPLPCLAIVQSDAKDSIFASSHIQTGINYFTTDPKQRYPGLPKVTRNGKTYEGIVYQSASGGITPEIIKHAIENVWGPCYPMRSADQVVGSLCDAYGHHWDFEVLKAMDMESEFFVGIMGVPNATGLWQVADIRNNGILKIKWVQAKRALLKKKREDKMKPLAERRVPEGKHDKLVPTDIVILLNMVFAPSHCDVKMNLKPSGRLGSSRLPGSFSITPRSWRALRRVWQPVRR